MQFNNETERMAHPQAGLIPASLWDDDRLFNNELPDALLPLMQADDGDLRRLLVQLSSLIRGSLQLKKCAWLVIAISHPNLSNETLFTLAQLSLDRNDLFKAAICWGKVNFFDYLSTQYEITVFQEMIASDNYEAFRKAARHGHLEMVNRLVVIHHDHLSAINRVINRVRGNYTRTMIMAGNHAAFSEAASHGHLAVVNRLLELSSGNTAKAMIAACNYAAFRKAASNGHLSVVKRLMEFSSNRKKVQAMIAAGNYEAFCMAAGNGHLEVINFLLGLSPLYVIHAMIVANSYAAFCNAARNGHLEMVNRLVELSPGSVKAMITANDYAAFREAAGHGHLAVVKRLVELLPGRGEVQAMIAVGNYQAFWLAAGNGHLAEVKYLVELSPGRREIQAMIAAGNYLAFREAVGKGHLAVVNCLLSFLSVFAYAEMHEREYRKQYVHLFINDKLTRLRMQKAAAEQGNPNVVFDIADPEEAKLCFYVIRNLIRRNDPALLDNISLLLDIPAVRALAHAEVTPQMPNELLRLAMSTGNWAAASLLLGISAVRELTVQNNYYRDEMQDSLDLAALARDCESSMPALSVGEQLPEPKEPASNAGLASEAGFFASTSARQALEIGTTNSPRVTR